MKKNLSVAERKRERREQVVVLWLEPFSTENKRGKEIEFSATSTIRDIAQKRKCYSSKICRWRFDLTTCWHFLKVTPRSKHCQRRNGRRAGLWLKFNLMKLKWIWIQSGAICFAKIAEFHHFWGALLPKVAICGYQWHFGCTNGNSETTFISRYKKSIISVQGLKAGAWKSTMSGGRKFSPKLPRMSQTLSLFMQSHTPPAGLPNSPQPCDTCAHCCRQHPVP